MDNNSLSKKAEHLLEAYRQANDVVSSSSNLDDKIIAYNDVISFCMDSVKCKYEDNVKRNQILCWAYNNIGDAFAGKNAKESGYWYDVKHFRQALEYYNSALKLCYDNNEKANVLGKISEVYRGLNDINSWLQIRQGMIDYLDAKHRREAYVNLASMLDDSKIVAETLESALDYVKHEDVLASKKCEYTVSICEQLLSVYEALGDKESVKRIKALQDGAKRLLVV